MCRVRVRLAAVIYVPRARGNESVHKWGNGRRMPAIHLGGDDWTLVRMWPESAPHHRWQRHLHSLLRGPVMCQLWLMRFDHGDVRSAEIDWTHPGVGKAAPSAWERPASKVRSVVLGTFDVAGQHVSFTSSTATRRLASQATTASIVGNDSEGNNWRAELRLDQPLRICSESAALLVVLSDALGHAMQQLAQSPAIDVTPGVGTNRTYDVDTDVTLRDLLAHLEPFQTKVLELICGGWTNAEIAGATRMSLSSVRTATSVIYERLGVRNRHEAAALCGAAFSRTR